MVRRAFENRLGVQAPPDVIWEAFSDIEDWPSWNPLYPQAAGKLAFGAKLDLTLALPGRRPEPVEAMVESWTPNELIHWRTRTLAGFAKSIRYLEIEKLTETGCIFSNGEIYEGRLGVFLAERRAGAIRAGFRAMGEAVKARAEAAWRARQAATT